MTETIGKETMTVTVMAIEVGDGMATEGKVIARDDGEGDGIQIPTILRKNIHKTIRHKITTSPLLWDDNINTNCPMSNTLPTHNHNSNTHRGHPHNRDKWPIYVSCVRIKSTMIINANLPVISWPEHKKHLIKATCIILMFHIKENGQMGIMIMMTPMANLFSKRGSRCH